MKIGSLFFAMLCLLPIAVTAQTADEIVAKEIVSRGGLSKIKAVQTQRISGTITLGQGAEGPFSIELKRPGKLHLQVTIQGQTLHRVYDGKSGWIINPFADNKDVQPMNEEDIRTISDESDFDGPLVDYKAKGHQIEFVKKEEFEGKPAYRLKLSQKNGDIRFYIFDAATYQLLKWEGSRRIDDKTYSVETVFRDYRDVNGLKFAFEVDSSIPDLPQQEKIAVEKVELNIPIDESRFAKPVVSQTEAPVAFNFHSAMPASAFCGDAPAAIFSGSFFCRTNSNELFPGNIAVHAD